MLLPAVNAQRFSMLPAWPMSFMEDEIHRCDTFQSGAKNHFPDWHLRRNEMENEYRGYGERYPHQGCRRTRFQQNAENVGHRRILPYESFGSSEMQNQCISPPINPRKKASKATPEKCKMRIFPTFFDLDGSLRPDFSGVSGRRYIFYG